MSNEKPWDVMRRTAWASLCAAVALPDTADEATRKTISDAALTYARASGMKWADAKSDGTAPRRQETGGLPTTLPPYGRAKGQPIATASVDDCRYYERGCLRTLDDASKERFHAKEKLMLEAIRARLRALGEAGDWE